MEFELRSARREDCGTLAILNRQLIEDEGSRNPMSLPELEARMQGWLETGWSALLITCNDRPAGYCLYQIRHDRYFAEQVVAYVRHYCIERSFRGEGLGRAAFERIVAERFPAGARLTLDVLATNPKGRAFWEALGFSSYCTTLERMPESR